MALDEARTFYDSSRMANWVSRRIHRIVYRLKRFDALIAAVATILLAIITGALAYIAVLQYRTTNNTDTTLHDTLVAANRAWLAPVGVATFGEITGDKDIQLNIYFENVGKGPALHMRSAFWGGTTPNTNVADYESISLGENKTCDGLVSENETVIFPSPGRLTWVMSNIARKTILPSIQAGAGVLYLQGCFAYQTMNEIHHTWFCMVVYRNGKFSTINNTPLCKDGQGAD
jgi:hypothetical protein